MPDARLLTLVGKHRLDLFLDTDVGLDNDGTPTDCLDGLACLGSALGIVQVAQDDIGAFRGEFSRHRLADS